MLLYFMLLIIQTSFALFHDSHYYSNFTCFLIITFIVALQIKSIQAILQILFLFLFLKYLTTSIVSFLFPSNKHKFFLYCVLRLVCWKKKYEKREIDKNFERVHLYNMIIYLLIFSIKFNWTNEEKIFVLITFFRWIQNILSLIWNYSALEIVLCLLLRDWTISFKTAISANIWKVDSFSMTVIIWPEHS